MATSTVPKFDMISPISNGSKGIMLFALDEAGDVWWFNGRFADGGWVKVSQRVISTEEAMETLRRRTASNGRRSHEYQEAES